MRMMRRQNDPVEQERGAVLILTAFLMVLLLGIAAVAVDIVIFQQARIRAQATVDASVLAAVQELPNINSATTYAQEYALRNYDVAASAWPGCSDSQALSDPTGVNCISVNDPTSPTLIRVRLPDRQVSTFFAPILGVDTFSVSATATAEIEYSGGSSEVPTDEGGATPQEIADFVRAGDPGGGYDTCGPIDPPSSLPSGPGATHWGEYIFVFEHLPIGGAEFGETTTVCGTSAEAVTDPSGNVWQWGLDYWVEGTGGTTHPGPGMAMHISCSEQFVNGWDGGTNQGPTEFVDTDWRVILYVGARYKAQNGEAALFKTCGQSFPPITSEPTTHIRLSD